MTKRRIYNYAKIGEPNYTLGGNVFKDITGNPDPFGQSIAIKTIQSKFERMGFKCKVEAPLCDIIIKNDDPDFRATREFTLSIEHENEQEQDVLLLLQQADEMFARLGYIGSPIHTLTEKDNDKTNTGNG